MLREKKFPPRFLFFFFWDKGCTLLQLTIEDFNKLLGPLEQILKRNAEEYVKPVNERNLLGDDASKICGLEELKTIGLLGKH